MMPASYLLSVTTSQIDAEVILTILNIAGRGQAFHGFSNETINTNLWIIPTAKGTIKDVVTQLEAIPTVRSVSIVALSNPVKQKELKDVRELFTQIGWDASAITDATLSLFINAKLQQQYAYYIDYDPREKKLIKINIKPIEEHPHFSPDWLKVVGHSKNEIQNRELTSDDIEIRSIVIETIEKEIEPPPPPPNNKQ